MICGSKPYYPSEMVVWEYRVLRCWHLLPIWLQLHPHSCSSNPYSPTAFGCKAISRWRETLWTGLANSPKPSQQTQHIQKAWDGPLAANQKNLILSRAPSDVDKARLLAAASPHSGNWLHAPPITAVGLRLSDEAIRVAVAHRLGSKACEPHTCVCCKVVDARGLHGLSCCRSAPRQQRHSHLSQSFE